MAWRQDTSRKWNKESDAHQRSEHERDVLDDQLGFVRPHKRATRTKRWGIELTYHSIFMRCGPFTYRQWYETERAREYAFAYHVNEKLFDKPRYTKVERCYR